MYGEASASLRRPLRCFSAAKAAARRTISMWVAMAANIPRVRHRPAPTPKGVDRTPSPETALITRWVNVSNAPDPEDTQHNLKGDPRAPYLQNLACPRPHDPTRRNDPVRLR